MNRLVRSAAIALGLSLFASAALACSGDCCGKDKDGKMTCCDKMKDQAASPSKPDEKKPSQPTPHAEHQH
jgi:hypothetical protein